MLNTRGGGQPPVGEVETWRHEAGDQHLGVVERACGLPDAGGDEHLRGTRPAQDDRDRLARLCPVAAEAELEPAGAVPEPQLVAGDDMPGALLVGLQQVVDAGAGRPRTAVRKPSATSSSMPGASWLPAMSRTAARSAGSNSRPSTAAAWASAFEGPSESSRALSTAFSDPGCSKASLSPEPGFGFFSFVPHGGEPRRVVVPVGAVKLAEVCVPDEEQPFGFAASNGS